MSDDEEAVDVATSAGALDPVVVLLREFLHRSGAVRAVAAVDRRGQPPAVVDVAQLSPIEIEEEERAYVLPHSVELFDVEELVVPDVRQLPRFDVDATTGEVTAPLGGMEHYADAVGALAESVGGRSVVLVTFATNDPDTPLSLSARPGERLVITIGEETFELPGA